MRDLIEKLQSAAGMDRELDIAIARACPFDGWRVEHDGSVSAFDGEGWYSMPTEVPTFTHSIDAARSLVPKGFFWLVSEGRTRATEPLGGAQVFRPDYLVKPVSEAEHESAAIALCIAALRARLVTTGDRADG